MRCAVALVTMVVAWAILVQAQCPEPLDAKACEVVLSIPGARLDALKLTAVAQVREAAPGVYAYRSGFDERFAVILSLEALPATGKQYPVIRVQAVPEAQGVTDSDIKRVLGLELNRLTGKGIIQGVSEEEKSALVATARLGLAGWDRRLVFDGGAWRPFNESSLYTPQRGCLVQPVTDYSSLPVWPAEPDFSSLALPVFAACAVVAALVAWRLLARRKS